MDRGQRSQPDRVLTREDGCALTRCQAETEECRSDIERCNDTCLYGSIDAFESCYATCRSIDCPVCSGSGDVCVVPGYTFSVTRDSDPKLQSACEQAVLREARCGESMLDPHCAHFAALERAEAADVYECIANTACGEDLAGCAESLPEGDLGRQICSRIGIGCSIDPCDDEVAQELDAASRWLDDQVVEAALDCLAEPCAGRAECLAAWLGAVFQPSAGN